MVAFSVGVVADFWSKMTTESVESMVLDGPHGDQTENEGGVNENANIIFSPDSASEGIPGKEDRVYHKAKRHIKLSPKKDEVGEGGEVPVSPPANVNKVAPFTKNSRKSRNARGRGLPKKGGAGGKGTWGAPGSEMMDDGECHDTNDPNYDSDSQDGYVVKAIVPEISVTDVHDVVRPMLLEYFEHGETQDVVESLKELNIKTAKFKLPGVAVAMAMDRKATHRELTSRLISDMYGSILTQDDFAKGFNSVLDELSDLTIDAPDAPNVLGKFIARAVADDCLPPKFVSSYKGKVECPHARTALDKADVLLHLKHGIVRLDNVWGVGGGIRPVKYLVKKMVLLLKEYLSAGDTQEATTCLQELEVPHFHHELVYLATQMVIEDSSERAADMMVKLIKHMYTINVLTLDQLAQGLKRIIEDMPDICLDVPSAYVYLERFGNKCYTAGLVSDALLKELPSKGRKRFVSEGDGGKIKDNETAS